MDCFPSPPMSPTLLPDRIVCGSCDKVLSSDWFCSDCHTKCSICNRFLALEEFCTRCWAFDSGVNAYVRKQPTRDRLLHPYSFILREDIIPSPTSSSSSHSYTSSPFFV
ncbi:uncharacterized protein BYT42DRAFT_567078 [Radiomyces spectabilis]|uniref:uncharacterized protein n=1 Tax=Radiomyces spectabilis TaxID=64574 RepID=UPI00221FD61B|nr:uncharacterized protein BYT42DRAFT_567078 [Radiomyces spectabilis]KAI8381588.1 hypothetical protein BYT42DRAFT_567078 [Radiomyces spectabilis]